MVNVTKTLIDLKAIARENSRGIRHLHYLHGSNKRNNGQTAACSEIEEEEVLSEYIPCDSYKDIQDLDQKLREKEFFENSVSKNAH